MQKYLEKFAAIATRSKKVFVFALPLVILFSVFPPAHADAFFWIPIMIGGIILTSLSGIPFLSNIVNEAAAPFLEALMWFVNLFVGLIASLLGGIYWGMGNLLHALVTYFIAIPVSPSNDALVGFVREAWNFSLLFVNALFLLILVCIGLATILRLQSYQLQRTLPLLIAIALLVNFSGVLVGFVVDISNIITNFFLKASVNAAWWTDPFSSFTLNAENLGQNIARILYYILGTLIYFIVMLLFGVRVIILWTLTILAPLAFAALILPVTKAFWIKWWSALIQWSIVGIPISFFLYLAGRAVNAQLPPSAGATATITSLIAYFFAPLTALVLLFIGITLSMQLAPAGAQGIVNFAKKLPKRITETRLGAKAAAWGASKTQGALSGIAKLSEARGVGMLARPLGWAAKGTNRLAGGKLLEYAASKRRMPLPQKFDQMSEPELEEWAKTNKLSNEDLVQLAARMQDKKKYKHTSPTFKKQVGAAMKQTSGQRWLHPDIAALADVKPEDVDEQLQVELMTLETLEETLERDWDALEKEFRKDPGNAGKTFGRKQAVDLVYKKNRQKVRDVAEEILGQAKSNSGLEAAIKNWAQERGKPIAAGANLTTDDVADLAAAKMYAVDLKPSDIPNILKPNSLAFALAVPDANPETLHRLFASFEKDKVEEVLSTPGGLNDRSNTKEKLIELQKSNPRLTRAIFNSSGYQHIDLEARKVLREKFGDNYKRFLNETSPQPPQPMPFRSDAQINGELQMRQQDLSKLPPLPRQTTKQRQEAQQLNETITRLQFELDQTPREQQMIQNMGRTQRVRDSLKKKFVEQERSRIHQQLKEDSSFLQAWANRTGRALEDIQIEQTQQLFERALAQDTVQSHLPQQIKATDRVLFQQIASKQQTSTDPKELAGGLYVLLQNIRDAEKRINENPSVPRTEWTNLNKMKTRFKKIRRELRQAGVRTVP